ncbi:MAG: hypothetical protein ACKO3P_21295, partial [Planctomycetaceae bacterium]
MADSTPVSFEPDQSSDTVLLEQVPAQPAVRAYPVLAWAVILVAVAIIAGMNSGLTSNAGRKGAINAVQDMQNRYLVGTLQVDGAAKALKPQIEAQLSSGKPALVLQTTLLVAEIEGAEAALRNLDQHIR